MSTCRRQAASSRSGGPARRRSRWATSPAGRSSARTGLATNNPPVSTEQLVRRLELDYPQGMDVGTDRAPDFGAILRQYRQARGFGIEDLCAAIGGTPGPGFLKSLEDGVVGPSSSLVLKLAEALGLPADLMLNAAGFATHTQRSLALAALPSVNVAPQRET